MYVILDMSMYNNLCAICGMQNIDFCIFLCSKLILFPALVVKYMFLLPYPPKFIVTINHDATMHCGVRGIHVVWFSKLHNTNWSYVPSIHFMYELWVLVSINLQCCTYDYEVGETIVRNMILDTYESRYFEWNFTQNDLPINWKICNFAEVEF